MTVIDFEYLSYGYSIPLIAFLAGSVIGMVMRAWRKILDGGDK